MRNGKMKIRGLIVLLFAVALSVLPQFANTSSAASGYTAQLISPTAGQVLYPGQRIRVEWRSVLPSIKLDPDLWELEVGLRLDAGHPYTMTFTPWLVPKAQFFYWPVPNPPTNQAVIDVRFGCEQFYPESYAPQPASMFRIANTIVPSY